MSDMTSLAEWSRNLGHAPASARDLLRRGRLPQAEKVGRDWLIPSGTAWPEDRRTRAARARRRAH